MLNVGTQGTTNPSSVVAGIQACIGGGQHHDVQRHGGRARTNYFATTAATGAQTVAVGGTFTSGDFDLMNSGVLNLSGSGFTTTDLRLGGDYGNDANAASLGLGATLNLTAATGGQTFASTINTVSSNTSGALIINSQNTSGTNTLSGNVFLDSSLAVNQSGVGGALLLGAASSTNTISFQSTGSRTLTLGTGTNPTGSITVNEAFANVTNGSDVLIVTGTGTTTIASNNSASGANLLLFNLQGGTLAVSSANNLGSPTVSGTGYPDKVLFGGSGAGTTSTLLINGNITYGSSTAGSLLGFAANEGTSANTAVINVGTGFTLTMNGALTDFANGSGTVAANWQKAGTGTLTQNGNITIGGGLTVSAGQLNIIGTSNSIGGDITTSGSAGLQMQQTTGTNVFGNLIYGSTGSLNISQIGINGSDTAHAVSFANSITVGAHGTLNIAKNIAFNGTGTLNWYNNAGTSVTSTTFSGAVTGNSADVNSTFSFQQQGSGANLAADTLTLSGSADNTNFSLTTGSSSFTYLAKTSSSSVHAIGGSLASALNINTGNTVQITGTGGDQIVNTAGVTINSTGTFDLNAQNETINTLTGNNAAAIVTNSNAAGTSILSVGGNNGSATFAGVIQNGAGTIGLSQIGTGTETLTGLNTYTGATTISSGQIVVGAGGQLSGTAITTSGTGILTEAATGTIKGGASLAQGSSGTAVLAGTNTYTGNTAVSAGTVSLTGSLSGTAISTSGTGVFNETTAGSIGGAASVAQGSSATSVLAGTNSFTGGIAVTGGSLAISGSTAALANSAFGTATSTLSVATGTLNLAAGGRTATNAFSLTSTSGVGLTLNSGIFTFGFTGGSGTSSTDSISLAGGTASVAGTNTINLLNLGSATLTAGSYTLLSAPGGGLGTASNFNLGTGGFINGYNTSLVDTGTLLQLQVSNITQAYWKGAISSVWNAQPGGVGTATNFTADAAGTTNLNNLPGSTTDVTFSAAGATNQSNTTLGQNFTIKSLTINDSAVVSIGGNALTLAGTTGATGITTGTNAGAVTISSALSFTGTPTVEVDGANGLTITGAITANGNGLIKNGVGTLNFNGGNQNYTGDTVVNAGNFNLQGQLYNNGAIAGNIIVNNGGTLTFGGSDRIGQVETNSLVNLVINAGGLVAQSGGYIDTFGGLTLNGGTLQGGSGTYQGAYNIRGNITVGGTTQSTMSSTAVGGLSNFLLSGPAGVTTGATNVNFTVNNTTSPVGLLVSAVLSNGDYSATGGGASSSSVTKLGAGAMALTAANTYTGGTVVNAGTLFVNNTSGSGTGTGAVTVSNSGSVLGGSGAISGAVTVNTNATLSPGAAGGTSTAVLTTGALTLAGTYSIDLQGATAGTNYDQTKTTGAVTLSGSSLVINSVNSSALTVGEKFYILLNGSTTANTGIFTGDAQGSTVSDGSGDTYTISYIDNGDSGTLANDVSLTVLTASGSTAVPEPTTWLGGMLAFGTLGLSKRRSVRRWLGRVRKNA